MTPTRSPQLDELAARIDHTLLKPESTDDDLARLVDEAIEHRFACVCVAGAHVAPARGRLEAAGASKAIAVASVVGFPLGSMATGAKADEARRCVAEGASELDMVIHIGMLRSGRDGDVQRDVAAVVEAAARERPGVVVKAILETAALTPEAIDRAARLAERGGADFVKTSTGFHPAGGATVEAVTRLRAAVRPAVRVKASGGIRTWAQARAMIDAGADRLGCSASVRILAEAAAAS